jgi:hypothetical protein
LIRAYSICARECIETIAQWAKVANHPDKILHIFHAGNSAWPNFEASMTQKLLDAYNILQPISQSHLHVTPLQAADILAHQLARNLEVSMGHKPTPVKLYTNRLFGKPGYPRLLDTPTLAARYREEMEVERLQAEGARVRRVLDLSKILPEGLRLSKAIFQDPRTRQGELE